MRRSMLIPTVLAIVFTAAVVPGMTQEQLVGVTDATQTLTGVVTDTTQTLVAGTQDLLTGVTGTSVTVTGIVVDSACYLARGKSAMGAGGHEKCAIVCAQKGQRLAIVTDKGDVYNIVGAMAQANNAKLLQFVNKTVVVVGQVNQVAVIVPDLVAKTVTDNRRPTGTEDGVTNIVKKGDSREGDNYAGNETVIDITTITLAKPISPAG